MQTWHSLSPHADQLGESPFWHPAEQRLYWVDIVARQLRRADPSTGAFESWTMPQEPGCIAPALDGGLVVALRDGFYRARQWGGELVPLHIFGHDTARLRFNDGKADPLGRFWAGTFYEPRDQPKAELFSLDCRPGRPGAVGPRVERMAGDATTANGLAWSPDARTVYWADTPAHTIRAWDWDGADNRMSQPRVFRSFNRKPPDWQPGDGHYLGRPDGAAVDSEGHYWVAMFEGGCVIKLSREGEVLDVLPVPMRCPTMPCFGGSDLRTLYLTSASAGRPQAELAAMPQTGHVVWLRVEVPGLPVNFFLD